MERALREHQAAAPERPIDASYAGDFAGRWDPQRIAQMASNLIGNALKHGTPGGPIQVHLDGSERDQVTLIVRNAGTIPADVLPQLFDPFRGDGLGLGLYIVSQIVRAHEGSVDVKTGEGRETAFHIRLPRAERRLPRAEASRTSRIRGIADAK